MINNVNEDNETSYYGNKNSTNNAKFFKLSGYISSISEERCFYLACPDCKKKVVEDSTFAYKCESCNKVFA
jgi:ribosomal protein L37AE/L43A